MLVLPLDTALQWILAGTTPDVHLNESWYKLIAFLLGLATSTRGSGMLTEATNMLATLLNICGHNHCNYRWLFVAIQVILAILTTVVLLPELGCVSDPIQLTESNNEQRQESGQAQE
jgi:hypothetical protein